jgi:PDZ domain-containing protein
VTRLRGRLAELVLLLGLLLLLLAAAMWIVPSDKYIFLPDVAHPVAPLVSVPAAAEARDADGGGIYFVDIVLRKATLLERLFPGIREGADVVPASAVLPPGSNDTQRRKLDLQEMSRSQSIASAVALRALGRKVVARPTGALVDAVDPKAPAAKQLHPGDRIVAVDGKPVRTPTDLRRLVTARPVGTALRLTLRSGSATRTVTVKTTTSRGRTVVGVVVEQAVDVKLPVAVRINSGAIGGPSAGLAFALDVMEELGRDVDRGHRVAATGEIALDGSVLPVGGLKQKTIGARRAHVELFLVPAGDNATVARRYAGGLRVVAVKSFRQALSALATLPVKQK